MRIIWWLESGNKKWSDTFKKIRSGVIKHVLEKLSRLA